MASSRIFVRGLPPSLSDTDFKKHFGSQGAVTDSRLFPERRIGYVGYKSPEEAAKAVRYFDRSFIRMSKIGVEIARPVAEAAPTRRRDWDVRRDAKVEESHDRGLKRKRPTAPESEQNPKLQEYLETMRPRAKTKRLEMPQSDVAPDPQQTRVPNDDIIASDEDEYQTINRVAKTQTTAHTAPNLPPLINAGATRAVDGQALGPHEEDEVVEGEITEPGIDSTQAAMIPSSDADWLRSRTTRLLGLTDGNDENTASSTRHAINAQHPADAAQQLPPTVETTHEPYAGPIRGDEEEQSIETEANVTSSTSGPADQIRESKRLYLRNLSYTITEDDLRTAFSHYGNLIEAHLPVDSRTGKLKGFAYLLYDDADSAVQAWREHDGKSFQGRLLHVLPASAKRENLLDDFALSKLPLKKQQQIKRKREASSATFNWNSMYMNADAVISSVADRLGVAKSDLLDPTSSDTAIRQAHAETHVIQETKAYFKNHGVDLDAFQRRERGDTAILVKNFPYDVKGSEIKRLFEEHGKVKNFLMPPSGTIAIVEYEQAPQARTAFAALAYRKVSNSVLFLEKAPKDLFLSGSQINGKLPDTAEAPGKATAPSASDLLRSDDTSQQSGATSTLFVRNLNFSTTSEKLTETFQPLDGFISARVKTKTDSKKPGQVLSMGFGFLEFQTKAQASAALTAMDGYSLEGHKLEVRASHKATDAAEERRREDQAKRLAGRRTKVVIKNLPFETTKKDVRSLFGSYGQLRSIRMPKKFDKSARGFAFAEFTTPKEAESAMDALRDTHLLGRRLVLDFAEEEPEDAEAEIEKMQKKVGSQINKVALQQLTGSGRKKFNVGDQNAEED